MGIGSYQTTLNDVAINAKDYFSPSVEPNKRIDKVFCYETYDDNCYH